MRVFSPTPMALARKVPAEGLTIGDKTFAPGTLVSVNSWVIHFSTEIWGSDAAEFRPDRWLEPNGAALEKQFMPVSSFNLLSRFTSLCSMRSNHHLSYSGVKVMHNVQAKILLGSSYQRLRPRLCATMT